MILKSKKGVGDKTQSLSFVTDPFAALPVMLAVMCSLL